MDFDKTSNSENVMTKFLEKLKKHWFLNILVSYCPHVGKNEISQKIGLCQFSNFTIFFIMQKREKIMSGYQQNWQTDRQMHG